MPRPNRWSIIRSLLRVAVFLSEVRPERREALVSDVLADWRAIARHEGHDGDKMTVVEL